MCGGMGGCGCSANTGSCGVKGKAFRSLQESSSGGNLGWNPNPSPYFGNLNGSSRSQALIDTYWAPAGASMPFARPTRRALGAIPGGWSQAEWNALTADQQTAVLKADQQTQTDIRNAISSGVTAALALARAGIEAGQSQADRDLQRDLAQIASKERVDIAKVQAAAGQPITGTTNTSATDIVKAGTAASSSTGTLLLVGGLGLAAYMFLGSGRRR